MKNLNFWAVSRKTKPSLVHCVSNARWYCWNQIARRPAASTVLPTDSSACRRRKKQTISVVLSVNYWAFSARIVRYGKETQQKNNQTRRRTYWGKSSELSGCFLIQHYNWETTYRDATFYDIRLRLCLIRLHHAYKWDPCGHFPVADAHGPFRERIA